MDEILARAGIFQGVEPSAVSALTKQLQPVDFPRGHTVFAEGEPGDRLYIIISGKVKIGRRSPFRRACSRKATHCCWKRARSSTALSKA